MFDITDVKNCTGCLACLNICPHNAIEVNYNEMGKTIPKINDNCVNCGLCISTCPENKIPELHSLNECYAVRSKSVDDLDCASGGAASVFSRYFLNENGIVCGVAFDKEHIAAHRFIDKNEDLISLKGSKYVQSFTGTTYKSVKKYLISGKMVLYTGTPCQIAGLKSYLKKDYDNLLTIDLICHGTPPSIYLKDYIDGLGIKEYDNISFRGKYDYKLLIYKLANIIYKKSNTKDYYFHSFYKGLTFRDNCYNCHYAQSKRISDITVGDFWGLDEKVLKNIFSGKASVILLNTEKGKKFFDIVKNDFIFEKRDIQEAIKGNDQLRHPSKQHKLRKKFETEYVKCGFYGAIKKVYKKEIIKSVILELPIIYQLRKLRYNIIKRKLK